MCECWATSNRKKPFNSSKSSKEYVNGVARYPFSLTDRSCVAVAAACHSGAAVGDLPA